MQRGFGYDCDNGCGYYYVFPKDIPFETKDEALRNLQISMVERIIWETPVFCALTNNELFLKIQQFEIGQNNNSDSESDTEITDE